MPELPEVTTTVKGLNRVLPKLTIKDVWSDYHIRTSNKRTDTIKNKKYFDKFKKEVIGENFVGAERRGKNVLIHLTHGKTILVHMKMTGHFLYGKYKFDGKGWRSSDRLLSDPLNQFVRLIFTLSNSKHLAFSDMRRFAKVILFETKKRENVIDLATLGPEPLENLSLKNFKKQLLKKSNGKIKTVLMDQTIIAGIGNIYSDEVLWLADVHPEKQVRSLADKEIKEMWEGIKKILNKSIQVGGDSMSDYRNIYGERGSFQNAHKVYRKTKEKCQKLSCPGIIERKVIAGRSSHFCNVHQK